MSRLIHAAARGARIEVLFNQSWLPVNVVRTGDNPFNYRIHPDDEHLQYGPISTALLKLAEDDSWNPSEERALALAVARQFQICFDGEFDFELYYLFLAEALADEGL